MRELWERRRRAFAAKPSHARASGSCEARVGAGLATTVSLGAHAIVVDLPESEGGTGTVHLWRGGPHMTASEPSRSTPGSDSSAQSTALVAFTAARRSGDDRS